jgi:hypothetical protein
MGSDPVQQLEDTAKNIAKEVFEPITNPSQIFKDPLNVFNPVDQGLIRTAEGLYEENMRGTPLDPLPDGEEPALPDRGEVITDVLKQEVAALARRRNSRTLLSGGMESDVPLASATIFGR